MTRSISPSWLSWVMELLLLQEPGLGVTEEETEEELEEPLGSTAALVKPDGLCQLRQREGTGAAGVEEEEAEIEVSKHPQPNL